MLKYASLFVVSCCVLGCGPAAPAAQKPVKVGEASGRTQEQYEADRQAQEAAEAAKAKAGAKK